MKSDELYRFTRGPDAWYMTSGAVEYMFEENLYSPVPLKRSAVRIKNELSKENLTIELPITHPLAMSYLTGMPNRMLGLTLFRIDNNSARTLWKGRLVAHEVVKTQAVLRFESIFTSLRRPGLRARYQRPCRHVVYSPGCRVLLEDKEVVGVCDNVSGYTLTIPEAAAFDDGYFRGGLLRQPDGTLLTITTHVGDQITVSWDPSNTRTVVTADGFADVFIYPGCDLSRATCDTVFGNILNYGGFSWIPSRNPFDGTSII